jgi:hypothetical protein
MDMSKGLCPNGILIWFRGLFEGWGYDVSDCHFKGEGKKKRIKIFSL